MEPLSSDSSRADSHNVRQPLPLAERLAAILQRLQSTHRPIKATLPSLCQLRVEDPGKFESGVRRVLDYLRAGVAGNTGQGTGLLLALEREGREVKLA